MIYKCFFFNDTATTEIYTLSLHDALPISPRRNGHGKMRVDVAFEDRAERRLIKRLARRDPAAVRELYALHGRTTFGFLLRRSEEHTSELQSRQYLVCRLLLEKKKYVTIST